MKTKIPGDAEMSAAYRRTLRMGAKALREYADEIWRGHTSFDGKWPLRVPGTLEAKRDHTRCLAIAKALIRMARRGK
jgi:hypothetical protein